MSAIAFLRQLLEDGLELEGALKAAERFEERAAAAETARIADRRAKDAARKQAQRVRDGHAESRGHDVTSCDSAGPPPHVGERTQVVTPSLPSLRSEELKIPPEKPTVSTPKGAETVRGTRLPDDWVPPAGLLASEFGLSHEAYADQVAIFRDYWRAVPGAKGRKADWPATWRNWVRRASENSARKAPHERPHTDAKFEARQANLARAFAGADSAAGRSWKP